MDILSLPKLSKKYKELKLNNPELFIKKIINLSYLNLSVHFSRDAREFDNINFQLLKYAKRIFLNRENFYKRKHINKILLRYFNSFKEYKYLFSINLPFIILKDIFTYGKQTIDSILVFLITLISILINLILNFIFK